MKDLWNGGASSIGVWLVVYEGPEWATIQGAYSNEAAAKQHQKHSEALKDPNDVYDSLSKYLIQKIEVKNIFLQQPPKHPLFGD